MDRVSYTTVDPLLHTLMMLWCFQLLALHLVLVNTLVITLPDVVVLKSTTTINFVTGSSDPSQWILRNVYANGTTQIGGTLSGTSSTTFAFQVTGPHFFQALALTNGTAASQPFYTGDVFTPVDLSATSSTSQSPLTATATQTVVSSSCPSSESAENATTETTNSTGTIVGSVIGGLGFSAALAFFLLWFNLRRQYKRLSRSAPSTLQIHNAPSTTPLMAPSNTYFTLQTVPHHSPALSHSSSSDLAHPMVNSPTPLTPQRRSTKMAVVNPDNSTTNGSHRTASLDMSETLLSNSSSQGRGRNLQSETGGVLRREVSLLRRELEEIRQAHSYDVPPPTY
ncbi:hypothetical protein F5050DRAFT_1155638 [Lentinula boryana]|uniref:Transmembrane protein n=1 Tax=Lentinula boryana TaxID=40481 RepID=A0ABQ8PYN9_9AGAR|nr:hypothetical protein F5050DRAFT_1155638 [Lentinula boryana]